MSWQPTLGARPQANGTHFRVWAPNARRLEVVLEGKRTGQVPLAKDTDGFFSGLLPDVRPGDLYRYRIDNAGPFPDPVSRFQPQGVHGPSEVIDPNPFAWTDASWGGVSLDNLVVYELHVGTFTPAGTFDGVRERLPYLAELGVTAIELMPLADFPGQRNWGYDGVDLFAPARCYGRPDDFRRLVDETHRHGLAVHLDVVYNHLGPDGNYLACYSPYYFSAKHHTAWGAAVNLDGPQSPPVRSFFIENALHWIHEYHIDGLRLDATHAMVDDGPRHFLAELVETVHAEANRPILLIAEDHRNLNTMLQPLGKGGWGLDGVWADDFHHEMRRFLAGDHEGYYRDYRGTVADLADTIRQGWFYTGQMSVNRQEKRGTDPTGIPPRRFVHCLQNHDQIGNRALGERLHQQIAPADYRAAVTLLLTAPSTPLLFMGQEWAAGTPFQFFTDHHPKLGKKVTEGRRREFSHFSAFSDPQAQQRIPDPQAAATFESSRLNWSERDQEAHAAVHRLYQALLKLRRDEPALRGAAADRFRVAALGDLTLLLERSTAAGPTLLMVLQCKRGGSIDLSKHPMRTPHAGRRWDVLLSTEELRFCGDPRPPQIDAAIPRIDFQRPGAVILRESAAP